MKNIATQLSPLSKLSRCSQIWQPFKVCKKICRIIRLLDYRIVRLMDRLTIGVSDYKSDPPFYYTECLMIWLQNLFNCTDKVVKWIRKPRLEGPNCFLMGKVLSQWALISEENTHCWISVKNNTSLCYR